MLSLSVCHLRKLCIYYETVKISSQSMKFFQERNKMSGVRNSSRFVPSTPLGLKGITTGIAHPPTKKAKVTVEYKCGTRVKTNQCTDVRVSLGMKSGDYCRMCYRKQMTTELLAKERKNRCRASAMGCPICKEPICKECWKEGYDTHAYNY